MRNPAPFQTSVIVAGSDLFSLDGYEYDGFLKLDLDVYDESPYRWSLYSLIEPDQISWQLYLGCEKDDMLWHIPLGSAYNLEVLKTMFRLAIEDFYSHHPMNAESFCIAENLPTFSVGGRLGMW